MKKLTTLLIAALGFAALPACGQTKHPSMLSFRVVDDLGAPVPEGEVKVSTFSHWVPGEGFDRDEYENFGTTLSAEGLASLTVPNIRGRLAYGVYPNSKYYPVTAQSYQFSQVRGGRWEPWNPEVTVVVPRKINPIPLHVRLVGNGPNFEMPTLGPVGFDLLVSDWVAPHGKGKRADFVFERKTVIPTTDPTRAFESIFTLTFSNIGDGIQSRLASTQKRLLELPREAPEAGYEPKLVKKVARSAEGAAIETGARDDQNYFFRVRTVINPDGKVISALFGKIHGNIECDPLNSEKGMLRFTYYLNPTPLDRNLEFDPKRNLLSDRLPGTNISEP